jgi:asparagine synthase (glutamine-hydrolysing)
VSPPATITPTERFHEMVQDMLRGPELASIPFCDQSKVIHLLDSLPQLSQTEAMAWDPHLTYLLSACVLHRRFRRSANC